MKKDIEGASLEELAKKHNLKQLEDLRELDTICTGCLELDVVLRGGLPVGKFSLIYGDRAVGKSMLAMNIASNALKLGYQVIYCDAENAVSLWKDSIVKNLQVEKMLVKVVGYMEEMCHIILDFLSSGSKVLVIVDTLTSVPPIMEDEEGIEKMQQALTPRLLSKFFRLAFAKFANNPYATVVMLNQVRESIGYYAGYVIPGGKAQEFASSIIIQLKSSKEECIFKDVNLPESDDVKRSKADSRLVTFVVQKSRVSRTAIDGSVIFVLKNHGKYKVGMIYNERYVRSMFRTGFFKLEWFNAKTQQEVIESLTDFKSYKRVLDIIVNNYET